MTPNSEALGPYKLSHSLAKDLGKTGLKWPEILFIARKQVAVVTYGESSQRGKGYEKDFLLTTYPFLLHLVQYVIAYPKVHITK